MTKVSEAVVGARFERLVVRSLFKKQIPGGKRGLRWLNFAVCDCDCGKQKTIRVERLGVTVSCGCLRIEHVRTHGLSRTNRRLYTCWYLMVRRCTDADDQQYHNYGARGISVCDEWRSSPVDFVNWAITSGYEDHLTLDRIDNDGNYCPENCRWATYKEQLNNTRANRNITFQGETLTVQQWAERIGISPGTLGCRFRNGWSAERALTEPIQHLGRRMWKSTKRIEALLAVRKAAEDLLAVLDRIGRHADQIAILENAIKQSK